jgi:hypothetical protein
MAKQIEPTTKEDKNEASRSRRHFSAENHLFVCPLN